MKNLDRWTTKPLNADQTYRWSVWAHRTALINAVTLIGGMVAAAGIYLYLRKRSPLAAFHALQALLMQLALWAGGGLAALGLAVLANQILRVSGFGAFLWPLSFLFALLPIASLIYALFAAWATRADLDFKYYKVGIIAWRIIQQQETRP